MNELDNDFNAVSENSSEIPDRIRQDGTRAIKLEELSNEELIEKVKQLTEQLKKDKAFGLVFERQAEDAIIQRKTKVPVLFENKEKIVNNGGQDNILIIGDNFDSLTCLLQTHRGKVDLIYIDPPYNTGNNSWAYNNDYVNKEDAYRHSKWLSFMEVRLLIAKELLSENGIIALAIDDYELPRIWMLFDAIFGEHNRLGSISVVHKPEGRNQEKFFATSNEFMIVYAKDKTKANFNSVVLSDEKKEEYSSEDEYGLYKLSPYLRSGGGDVNLRKNKESFWYPIFVDDSDGSVSLTNNGNMVEVFPITNSGVERTWQTKKETLQSRIDSNVIIGVKNAKGKFEIFEKYYANEKGQLVKTHWIDPRYSAISNGTNILNRIIGEGKFDYPKSLPLMEDIIKIMAPKDGIILDFFAGSGTTGHAVLNVNKEDGGNRKFILCTNDESNIGSSVTYQRIKNVIRDEWYDGSKHQAHEASLRYYNINHVKNDDMLSQTLINELEDTIKIKENAFIFVKEGKNFSIFTNNKSDIYVAILKNRRMLNDLAENFALIKPASLTIYNNGGNYIDEDCMQSLIAKEWEIEFISFPDGFIKDYKFIDERLNIKNVKDAYDS